MNHIVFDLGGVLLNIDLTRIVKGFSVIMKDNPEALINIKTMIIPSYEVGDISTQEFLDVLGAHLKEGFTEGDIVKVWNSIILDFPQERLDMLLELRKHFKVHLLSNINDLHANCFEENFRTWFNSDPRNYFDGFYYSHQIGRRKPDVSTYTWVLEQLQADAEEVIFIDDMPENIEGARSAGIVAYQLMSPQVEVIDLVKKIGLFDYA